MHTGNGTSTLSGICWLDSHLRVDFRSNADAVIAGDGEFMVKDPAGGGWGWLTAQVGRERMKVSHMAMS